MLSNFSSLDLPNPAVVALSFYLFICLFVCLSVCLFVR